MRSFEWLDVVTLVFAIRWTVILSLIGIFGGAPLALLVALARTSRNRWARMAGFAYVRIFQSTPLLMQLFLVYFGLSVMGASLDPLAAASIAIIVNAAAFLGEIWRGCIESVPKGQGEAAQALALKSWQRAFLVVLPQAVKIAIPPTVVYLVQLIKNTSLASIIGFVELTRTGQIINNATFDPFLVFSLVALFYFVLCWPLSWISKRLEARMASA